MNTIKNDPNSVSNKQVIEYFTRQAEMEKEKKESRRKVMDQQLAKVTGGKNIIISNKPH